MYKVKVKVFKFGYYTERFSHETSSKLKAYLIYYAYKGFLLGSTSHTIKLYKVTQNTIFLNKKTYFWNN